MRFGSFALIAKRSPATAPSTNTYLNSAKIPAQCLKSRRRKDGNPAWALAAVLGRHLPGAGALRRSVHRGFQVGNRGAKPRPRPRARGQLVDRVDAHVGGTPAARRHRVSAKRGSTLAGPRPVSRRPVSSIPRCAKSKSDSLHRRPEFLPHKGPRTLGYAEPRTSRSNTSSEPICPPFSMISRPSSVASSLCTRHNEVPAPMSATYESPQASSA